MLQRSGGLTDVLKCMTLQTTEKIEEAVQRARFGDEKHLNELGLYFYLFLRHLIFLSVSSYS